ncbi:MAG: hypothetical protein J0H68_08810 [Sphingobacteriia bacterium]|nr:hypothetical protein [Sphingobacteriia bacterium]
MNFYTFHFPNKKIALYAFENSFFIAILNQAITNFCISILKHQVTWVYTIKNQNVNHMPLKSFLCLGKIIPFFIFTHMCRSHYKNKIMKFIKNIFDTVKNREILNNEQKDTYRCHLSRRGKGSNM